MVRDTDGAGFKRACGLAILILLAAQATWSQGGGSVPVPQYYGYYLVDVGKLFGIDVNSSTTPLPVTPVRIEQIESRTFYGLPTDNGHGLESSLRESVETPSVGTGAWPLSPNVQILLYAQPGGFVAPLQRLEEVSLRSLPYVHTYDSQVVDGWDDNSGYDGFPGFARKIDLLIKPVAGHQDMILAAPATPLSPGVYKVSGNGGDRDVGFLTAGRYFVVGPLAEAQKQHCIEVLTTPSIKGVPCGSTLSAQPSPAAPAAGTQPVAQLGAPAPVSASLGIGPPQQGTPAGWDQAITLGNVWSAAEMQAKNER